MSRESDTRLFVGRLSRDVRQRDLEDLFSRYGTIKNCSLKSTYGFVEFEDPRDAKDALALDGSDLEGSRIVVEFSRGRREPRDRRGGYGDRYDDRDRRGGYDRGYDRGDRYGGGGRGGDRPPSRFSPPRNSEYRVIVEDIPPGCSWQHLKDHFRSSGDVCFADVRRERGGRDYGVVEFKYEDDLLRAVDEMDRSRLNGSTIRVINDFKRRSRSRDRRSPSPRDRRSPSPRGGSPRGGSPRGASPRGASPRGASPRGASPRGGSPRGGSPVRRSPRGGSPVRRSPVRRSPARRSPSPRRDSRSPVRRSPDSR